MEMYVSGMDKCEVIWVALMERAPVRVRVRARRLPFAYVITVARAVSCRSCMCLHPTNLLHFCFRRHKLLSKYEYFLDYRSKVWTSFFRCTLARPSSPSVSSSSSCLDYPLITFDLWSLPYPLTKVMFKGSRKHILGHKLQRAMKEAVLLQEMRLPLRRATKAVITSIQHRSAVAKRFTTLHIVLRD
jgi:hypothetical protein